MVCPLLRWPLTMNFLPADLPSFVWGIAIGAVAAFGTGFLQKAGEAAFAWLSAKINPETPAPTEVDRKFQPSEMPAGKLAWVNEPKRAEYEDKGFGYYPHPKTKAPCFRISHDGHRQFKEYLMVSPEMHQQNGGHS